MFALKNVVVNVRRSRPFLTSLAAGIGLASLAAGLTFLTPAKPTVAQAPLPVPQSAWRFCDKCNSMFYDGYADKGRCSAGGGHHAQGLDFVLSHDAPLPGQNSWRYCGKCHILFYDGFPNKGRCAAGGGHAASGYNFVLRHDEPTPGQNNWRFCAKCNSMFYNGFPAKGNCPSGGGHEASGFNFVLPYLPPPPPPAVPTPQINQLDFDTKPIGFSGGVPVGGWSHLTIYRDGGYHFTGHFHVSGAPSYNVGMVWMVRAANGQTFLFTDTGSLHGTFSSGSRDHDWDKSGNNAEIARNWSALVANNRVHWQAKTNMDLGSIINSVKQLVEAAGTVVKIIQVVGQ